MDKVDMCYFFLKRKSRKEMDELSEGTRFIYFFNVRDHPYITSAKELGGWNQLIAIFAEVY